MIKNKVFYNCVINEDLFYTIYDYLWYGNREYWQKRIKFTDRFNDLSLDEWKSLANDTITWLEENQLPKVYELRKDDNSPSSNSWGTLYYQTLAYINRNNIRICIRENSLENIISLCKECIDDFKKMINDLREPNDEDLDDS